MRGGRFKKILIFKLTIVLYIVLRSNGLDNKALHKPVIQSSTWTPAERAVDGNRANVQAPNYVCTHTDNVNDLTPWWMVDMLDVYVLEYIVIYNRASYQDRLDNLSVDGFLQNPLLTNRANPQNCGHNPGPSGDIVNMTCSGLKARYLLMSGPVTLTLCEVEAYGENYVSEGCLWRSLEKRVGMTMSSAVTTVDFGQVASLSDCSFLCLQRLDCNLFNYNVVNGQCKVPVGLFSDDKIESNGDWNLYVY